MVNLIEINEKIKEASAWVSLLKNEIGRVVVGQKTLIDRLIIALLVRGHVLIEGVPGLAKTLTIKTFSQAIQASFQRIQFTPDLLPSDIIGTLIYRPQEGVFKTKHGPIFANIVLADEINRAPAKVQSALLEAMQEHQVTIGEQTYALPHPFLVLATENPIDQEGTYVLPEAQVDRFMFKLVVEYPTKQEERTILDRMSCVDSLPKIGPVITIEEVMKAAELINTIYVDDKIKDYTLDIVLATRKPSNYQLSLDALVEYGASPRATIALTLAAKAHAFLNGRGYVVPQDIKSVAMDVLRHRVIVSYEAEAEGVTSEDIIKKILNTLPVP